MAAEQQGIASTALGKEAIAGPSSYKTDKPTDDLPATSSASDFSSCLTTWREVNLPTLQGSLATLCPTLIESQKDALLSRKRLAEQTREFRKLSTESQAEAIKPLLKSYQAEIDSLTKRAKSAENAVLSVQDRLQLAKDPYPVLEAVLEQMANSADLVILREQIEVLQSKNTSLDTQLKMLPSLEAEKTRLTNRITQLESALESRVTDSRKGIEAELTAKWDERIRNHEAREEDLKKSLASTQSQLKEVRGNYAKVTERLLQHGEEVERDQRNGKIEELEMISEELSRSNERVRSVERRNEQLRQEIERLKIGTGETAKWEEMERRQQESDDENRRLSSLLEEEGRKTAKSEEDLTRRIKEMEVHSKEKERETSALRKRIQNMNDYDEIKRELDIFKYVEFAVEADRQMDGKDGEDILEHKTSTTAKPLEALLIEKNRQLQNEVTNWRVANTELEASSSHTKKVLEQASSEVLRLKTLNERLEDDLINLKPGQQGSSRSESATKGMSAEEALAEMDKIAQGTENGEESATKQTGSESVSQKEQQTTSVPPFDSAKGSNPAKASTTSSSASSILPIITSQRDRFRARNAELEEELRKQFETISELRSEVKTLQSDNLGLYEKMRYLQAYGNSSNGSQSLRGPGGGSRMVNISARNDPTSYPPSNNSRGEDKYRDKYEAAMNPFEQFRGREQSRAFNSLNPLERVLHIVTRLVLGHRRMRIFFIVYAISLHLLVFAMLFEIEFYSGTSSESLTAMDPAVLNQ